MQDLFDLPDDDQKRTVSVRTGRKVSCSTTPLDNERSPTGQCATQATAQGNFCYVYCSYTERMCLVFSHTGRRKRGTAAVVTLFRLSRPSVCKVESNKRDTSTMKAQQACLPIPSCRMGMFERRPPVDLSDHRKSPRCRCEATMVLLKIAGSSISCRKKT